MDLDSSWNKRDAHVGLQALPLKTDYRTGADDPISDFYRPCLSACNRYDRAVGYFRSSIYLVVGSNTVQFARRGGKIRLICSPSLYADDTQSILKGYEERALRISRSVEDDLDELLLAPETEYRTRVLATLIATGALDIRLAIRPNGAGIYHEKIGIFFDQHESTVSFIGSANETWSAWHEQGNFESIEVFCSWHGERDAKRIKRHIESFNSLWEGNSPGIETHKFPDAVKNKLIGIERPSIEKIDLDRLEVKTKQETKRSPQPHQIDAIQKWISAGRKGIFEHATGSGKTYTALTAAKPHIKAGNPVIILVPSELLLKQWRAEIKEEHPNAALLLAGSGNNSWRRDGKLKVFTSPNSDLGERIVLSTMQTAATDEFLQLLKGGDHLMMIADEVHQLGSRFNSKAMTIPTGPRIGLSATPNRYGDPEGTLRIKNYFGETILPKVTLEDAIKAGRLVEYEYHPHPIRLTAEESDAWRQITARLKLEIAKASRNNESGITISEQAKMLLIRRSRIAKKAINKISLAKEVIGDNFEAGGKWLIYCEDQDQLTAVKSEIESLGVSTLEYHSEMAGDKTASLDWFSKFGGVMVSIRCLDEGIDIPSISHALILASSQNPRQFIQRRGRVLRKSDGKNIAVIHDAIVVPDSLDQEPDQEALIIAELSRAVEFSNSAINRSAGAELRHIAINLGIDIETMAEKGIEEIQE